jgi:anti-sigma B factor antagonist
MIERGPVRVVRGTGDIDLANAGEFRAALVAAAGDGLPVVVDLSDVTFLDAAGVGALAAGRRAAGGRFRLVGARGVVHRILSLTGFLEPAARSRP